MFSASSCIVTMKERRRLFLPTLEETCALGTLLGSIAAAGDIITLTGTLGAGKTTLTQAIGKGLKVPDSCYITSPTFSLVHEYPGRIPLYHMDLYRLTTEEEIPELGLEDYLYGSGVAVIEWPERLGSLLPQERLDVELSFSGETARNAVLTAFGAKWAEKIAAAEKIRTWLRE